jgi:endonuclease/exonuclease/phosphatase family metal-dependent hydrolase
MKNKNRQTARALILAFLFLMFAVVPAAADVSEEYKRNLFSYAELTTLYEGKNLSAPLEEKLNRLLTTPFVENSAPRASVLPVSKSKELGEFLRVVQWNIERGLEYEAIEAAFTSEERFAALLNEKDFPPGSRERLEILQQASLLRAADVIVLNEVDWGMKRTEYRSVAADLARSLRMNYAFGVQFVELSPVHLSQNQKPSDKSEAEIARIVEVDPELYKGLHGVAILSRFPLENVRLAPFKHQPYDWFESEKKGASMIEKGKRELSSRIFLEETLREVRRGGRTTLLAEIADARFPGGRVTIAATHLENRTKPSHRQVQLKELLGTIENIPHPVILAGDMNTSTTDLTPTSIRRELMKRLGSPKFWIKTGVNYALGFGLIEDFLMSSVTFGRTQSDPTVRHIPLVAPNPERKFFQTLEEFRFSDGGAFDFRGDPARSNGEKSKSLSNSNERGRKGFVTTYQVPRPIFFVGKFKLDWIFVKPAILKKDSELKESYRFAPHFGRTLTAVNEAVEDRISDHRPLIVDLPLGEPPLNSKAH